MNSESDAQKAESQVGNVLETKQTGQNKSTNQILHEFAGYTTAHGLNRLVESVGVIRKLVWATFCLGAFVMFLLQTHRLFKQYLARPVATTVTVEHPTDVKFPAITICNLNMVRFSKIPKRLRDYIEEEINRFNKYDPDESSVTPPHANDTKPFENTPEGRPSSNDQNNCDYDPGNDKHHCDDQPNLEDLGRQARLVKSIILFISNMDKNRRRSYGHQFNRFIYDCTFMGYSCLNFTKFWITRWNYRYGNCFTFNSGFDNMGRQLFVKEIHKTGPSHGLKLAIDIERPEYFEELSEDAGAIITVTPQGHLPFPDDSGVSVMPGRTTFIGLRKETIERVDPFGNGTCYNGLTLASSNIYARKRNILYSPEACIKSCLATEQYLECGCAEVQFQSPNMPGCNELNSTEEKCLKLVKQKFRLGKLDCASGCPAPCREAIFKSSLSSSRWPSKGQENKIRGKLAKKKIRVGSSIEESFLQVKIYFEQLNYQRVQQSLSYKEENLVADIGGQLGLWIGISVLTACEFIELAFMLGRSFLRRVKSSDSVAPHDHYT